MKKHGDGGEVEVGAEAVRFSQQRLVEVKLLSKLLLDSPLTVSLYLDI